MKQASEEYDILDCGCAMMVSSRINNLFKWSAVSHAVPKTLFDQVAAAYIQDKENHDWLSREPPCGMEEIMGEVQEDFQGSRVEIIQADDVDKWHLKWGITKT